MAHNFPFIQRNRVEKNTKVYGQTSFRQNDRCEQCQPFIVTLLHTHRSSRFLFANNNISVNRRPFSFPIKYDTF